jgi:hypothetical protein
LTLKDVAIINVGLKLFDPTTLITDVLNIKNLRLETKAGVFTFNGPSSKSLKVIIDSFNSAVSLGTNVMDLIINNADSVSISVIPYIALKIFKIKMVANLIYFIVELCLSLFSQALFKKYKFIGYGHNQSEIYSHRRQHLNEHRYCGFPVNLKLIGGEDILITIPYKHHSSCTYNYS